MSQRVRFRVAQASSAVALVVVTLASLAAVDPRGASPAGWTPAERSILRSLSLSALKPLGADPSNKYADDDAAARFGGALFFDARLSANGEVSCASCHVPGKGFQDGIPLGKGVGTAGRRTMPVAGTGYSAWQFWDGRADSHWSQALGPLESAVEHGGDRVQYAHVIAQEYRKEYEAIFGAIPGLQGLPKRAGPVADTIRALAWRQVTPARQQEVSRIYANIGKAIAAYERRVVFTPTRFDRFVAAELAGQHTTPDDAFTQDERAGLALFIGKGRCATCHTGPLLTDNQFHNTGVPKSAGGEARDVGRASGGKAVLTNEFNCLSIYSDARPADCAELRFAVTDGPELIRAYKTPSLRNAATRPPFMHAGQLASMAAVLSHYNRAPAAPEGKSELRPLHLSRGELAQLEAFLGTLVSPVAFPAPTGPGSKPAERTGQRAYN